MTCWPSLLVYRSWTTPHYLGISRSRMVLESRVLKSEFLSFGHRPGVIPVPWVPCKCMGDGERSRLVRSRRKMNWTGRAVSHAFGPQSGTRENQGEPFCVSRFASPASHSFVHAGDLRRGSKTIELLLGDLLSGFSFTMRKRDKSNWTLIYSLSVSLEGFQRRTRRWRF